MNTAADGVCQIILIRDPLHPAQTREEVPCRSGQWLGEAAPAECLSGDWVAVDRGRVLARTEWSHYLLVPGAEILLYPRLGDSAIKIATGIVFPPLGVYWALRSVGAPAWASGLLVGGPLGAQFAPSIETILAGRPSLPPVPSLSSGDLESSPTYGFSGIQNSTRVGAPIPVVYGTHRVGGQLIGSSVVTKDDNDVLHLLLALSEGEITGISDIEINEQPVGNYTGVVTEQRLGTNTQSAIGLFGDKSATTIGADAQLTDSFTTYTTQGTNLTGFEVKLTFPGGLFYLNDEGGFALASVSVEVDYRLVGAGGWTTGPRRTYTDAKRAVLRRTMRVDSLPAGQYDIRVRRTTAESTSSRLIDAVRREAITELVNDGYLYPNTALLAIEALATNQISGGLPRITALVQGVKVKVWSSASAYTVAYSNNPAWVVFDMLTSERYGHGRFTWETTYRTGTIGVTNGSSTFGGTGTGWTAANLRKGDVLHVPSQGRIGIVASIDYGTQIGTFTQTWGGATQTGLAYEVRANDLDVQSFVEWATFCDELVPDGVGGTEKRATVDMVFDADRQAVWDAVVRICGIGQAQPVKIGRYIRIKVEKAATPVQLFTMANLKADSFEEFFLPLKERANIFEVQYLNGARNYQQDIVVLEDPLLFTNSEQPRRKTVSGYGIIRSSHAARLARFNQKVNRYVTRTITFEVGLDAVACEPGDVIRFQHDVPQWGFGGRAAAGSTSNTIVLDREVTIQPAISYEVLVRHADDTIETKTVTTGPGTVTTLTISGTWASTPAKGEVWAFGAVAVSTKPFRVVTIERTQELDARITAVEYHASVYDDSSVTEVNQINYSALGDLAGPPGNVRNLVLLEQDLTARSVWVSFTPPGSANFKTAKIYRSDSGTDVFLGESSDGAFSIAGIAVGELITVKVTSVSTAGVESDKATAPTASLVLGQVHPPDVSGLTQYFESSVAYLTWTAVNWVLQVEYELRKGAQWDSAIVLGRTPANRIAAAGDGTYWVAARDSSGAYSLTPVSLVVTGATLAQNVLVTLDEDENGWPGTTSGDAYRLDNTIKLGGVTLFDPIADLDAEPGLIDSWGGIATTGTYEIPASEIINLGTSKPCAISATYEARGEGPYSLFDDVVDVDAIATFDGSFGALIDVVIQLAIAGNDDVFGGWVNLVPGQYVGKQFKFRAVLTSLNNGVTAVLTDLDIVVDMPDRIETAANVTVPASGLTVSYSPPFQARPSVQIMIVNATDGDDAKLTNESATGFDVVVRNGGSGVARSINWMAVGY